jgi:tetratricopeptide (TPR) repeat protein
VTCLDDDIVLGLVEGRLGAAILADVDVHLDTCPSCRDVVAQVARVSAPSHVLERGHTVGRYVIGDLLGAGAMGRVYSAWEPELDRRVALKLLVEPGAGARARVIREAQAMAKLDHPNVVGVHEVGTSEDGVYVAMELVEGMTLRAWAGLVPGVARRSPPPPVPVRPWREVVPVLIEIARGLAAVHAAGVIHRDIKPENIIVGADGRARLGDFGLARSGASTPGGGASPPDTSGPGTGATEPSLALGTPTSAIAGTPAYMAPELLRGRSADEASDQFSFGVLAYEVLGGKRPFGGTTWAALLQAIEAGNAPALRGVPAWLEAALQRCLEVAPAKRFESMAAIADHLASRSTRRRPTTWLVGAAAAAAIASGVTWVAVRRAPVAASCEVGAAEIARVWTPQLRARLAPLGATALASLDAWAAQWTDERDAACRAAITAPPPVTVARDRCVDQRRAELAALLERLGRDPSAALADRVVDALAVLPAAAECRAIAPGAADPLPLDPAKAAVARGVQDALPAVRAAVALGDARPVIAVATELVGRARDSGHAATLAEALIVDAEALRATSQLFEAQTAARDAVAAAERGHDDLLAARAWLVRLATAGDRRDLAVAEDTGAIAAGAVERAGSPPRLVATLLRQRGLIAYNRGLLDDARTLLTDARTRFVELSGADSLDVATTASALGSVARAAGDLDAAETWHRSAFAIDRSLRNAQHPDLARDLHNIAGVLRLRGKLDEAATTYHQALAIEEASRGATSVEAGLTHNSLGLVYMASKDWVHAREELTLARDILTAAGHGDRAFAHHNLGLVEAYVGDHRLALRHYERAAAAYHETIGDGAAPAIRLELDRGRAMLALNDSAGAQHVTKAREAAAKLPIAWIVTEADALLAMGTGGTKRAENRPGAVEVSVEPPIRGIKVTQPAAAETTPMPPPPQPKRDVGVYGSTQSW